MKRFPSFIPAFAVAALAMPLTAQAGITLVPIANPSFESPGGNFSSTITNWNTFGSSTGEVKNGQYSNFISNGDGTEYAFITNGKAGSNNYVGIYQTLSSTVQAGTYDLRIGLAVSSDQTGFAGASETGTFTLRLANPSGGASYADTIIQAKTFSTSAFQYYDDTLTVPTGSSLIGKGLQVVLFSNADAKNGYNAVADNATLTLSTPDSAAPEPSEAASLGLAGLGLLGLGLRARRRPVPSVIPC